MKKSCIKVGAYYSNGKGRIREVLDIGDFPLYPGQEDHDCVKYGVVNDGTKRNVTAGKIGVMTRTSFAIWAKQLVTNAESEAI